MNVEFGDGQTKFGPGVAVTLTGDEIATAISAYLVAHGVHISGPRTISVNDELCESGRVYVDPSGSVVSAGQRLSGRGPMKGGMSPYERSVLGLDNAACRERSDWDGLLRYQT